MWSFLCRSLSTTSVVCSFYRPFFIHFVHLRILLLRCLATKFFTFFQKRLKLFADFSEGVFMILKLRLSMMMSFSGWRRFCTNDLIGSYFCIDCPWFGLKVRHISGLPGMIIIEKIIPFHELLRLKLLIWIISVDLT